MVVHYPTGAPITALFNEFDKYFQSYGVVEKSWEIPAATLPFRSKIMLTDIVLKPGYTGSEEERVRFVMILDNLYKQYITLDEAYPAVVLEFPEGMNIPMPEPTIPVNPPQNAVTDPVLVNSENHTFNSEVPVNSNLGPSSATSSDSSEVVDPSTVGGQESDDKVAQLATTTPASTAAAASDSSSGFKMFLWIVLGAIVLKGVTDRG